MPRIFLKALKSSLEEKCRRRAAELLLTLYRKHKRQDIRKYNGTFIAKERADHYDTHSDETDCYIHMCDHSDVVTNHDVYRDVRFNTEQT